MIGKSQRTLICYIVGIAFSICGCSWLQGNTGMRWQEEGAHPYADSIEIQAHLQKTTFSLSDIRDSSSILSQSDQIGTKNEDLFLGAVPLISLETINQAQVELYVPDMGHFVAASINRRKEGNIVMSLLTYEGEAIPPRLEMSFGGPNIAVREDYFVTLSPGQTKQFLDSYSFLHLFQIDSLRAGGYKLIVRVQNYVRRKSDIPVWTGESAPDTVLFEIVD